MDQYIATQTILDLCLKADNFLGAQVAKQWWDN